MDDEPWLVLAAFCLLSVGVNAFVIAPSSVMPLFVDRFGITESVSGNIISAPFVGQILTQLPGGYLLDRYDNRRFVAVAVLAYAVVLLAIQPVEAFWPFLLLRALGGVFVGLVFIAGANVIGQAFPADRQALATGIYLASPPGAFALAHITSPPLATAFGPMRVFLLHAGLALAGLALFLVATAGPIRSAGTPTPAEYTRALRDRSVILVGLSLFAVYALYLFLNTWLPRYGLDVLSLPLSSAAVVTAVVPLVGILARPSGGWLSDRVGGRRRPVIAGGLVAGLVLLAAIPLAGSLAVFVLLIAGAAFGVQLCPGVTYVLTRELSSAGTEGTSLTVLSTISFVGSVVAPAAGGWLIAEYSWSVAFTVFAGVGVLGILVLLPVPEPGSESTGAAAPADTD
jgi:nitrate/nitrite transporter NarK